MTDLPYSRETEQALIGRLLLDPAKIAQLQGVLRGEYFHVPEYREAYDQMVELTRKGKSVDVVTLGGDQQVQTVIWATPSWRIQAANRCQLN